jgi:hypothetical protein
MITKEEKIKIEGLKVIKEVIVSETANNGEDFKDVTEIDNFLVMQIAQCELQKNNIDRSIADLQAQKDELTAKQATLEALKSK